MMNTISNILFPAKCVSCELSGSFICEGCKLKFTNDWELRFSRKVSNVDLVMYFGDYKNTVIKDFVKSFKYKFIQELKDEIHSILVRHRSMIRSFLNGADLIPVPLHQARLNWRGFNQSMVLCEVLSEISGCSISNDLKRIIDTRPQVECQYQERLINVKDAFEAASGLSNDRYVIVDDVFTTGSTLSNCGKALYSAGARNVKAITLAH